MAALTLASSYDGGMSKPDTLAPVPPVVGQTMTALELIMRGPRPHLHNHSRRIW